MVQIGGVHSFRAGGNGNMGKGGGESVAGAGTRGSEIVTGGSSPAAVD